MSVPFDRDEARRLMLEAHERGPACAGRGSVNTFVQSSIGQARMAAERGQSSITIQSPFSGADDCDAQKQVAAEFATFRLSVVPSTYMAGPHQLLQFTITWG